MTHLAEKLEAGRGVYGQVQTVHAVAAVYGDERFLVRPFRVVLLSPPHDGIPLANLPSGLEEIGLTHEEVQVDDGITAMDTLSGAVERKGRAIVRGLCVGQGEAVTVVRISLADGIINHRVVPGMHPEVKNPHGIASPLGRYRVANDGVPHDRVEVKIVFCIIPSLANLTEELKRRNLLYGQVKMYDAVVARDGLGAVERVNTRHRPFPENRICKRIGQLFLADGHESVPLRTFDSR